MDTVPETVGGLTSEEAARRMEEAGANELRREVATPAWKVALRQLLSPMVALLAAACALSAVLGDVVDATAIGAIILLNAAVGFVQEYRAERAVLALRAMTAPRARVRRDGGVQMVPAAAIVPGDLLLLEAGDVVAADARLLQAHGLRANEAMLTGESVPVDKVTQAPADEPDGGLVFAGTAVVGGAGEAEVLSTGMSTRIGQIAHLLETAQEEVTPLQAGLSRVTLTLVKLCLVIVAAVALIGLWRGLPALEVMMGAVSLAVAAVPEGLPAVVTVALALGVQRMAARDVLVRRMHAVETLGAATVVCTDKTGTLTTGEMVVRDVWGEDPHHTLRVAASCCDADLSTAVGDPTELALLAAAAERGILRPEIEARNPRVSVMPFDADRKRMSVLRADGVRYVKGAFDLMLPLVKQVPDGAEAAAHEMAARGLRVLAMALGGPEGEEALELVGLTGLVDPPRPEVIEAVRHAREAGIITVMITGDHHVTATAIAHEIGILRAGEPPQERVHARATPEDKMRLVRAWKERGAVVAMTGDGVNDAPALREAHIGVAMGRKGTEVTREAADMVLVDDDYASIIEAIREGRAIYDNIRKTLIYLLTGNGAELGVMLLAAVAGLPVPLLPIQLLWINLVTDGLPALALVADLPEADVLRRPPRPPDEQMLGWPQWRAVAFGAGIEAAVVLGAYAWALQAHGVEVARTFAFDTLVFSELLRAFGARSTVRIFWQVGALSNLRLVLLVLVSGLVQVLLHQHALTRELFGVVALPYELLGLAALLGLIPVTVQELAKLGRQVLGRPAAGAVRPG